MKNAEEKWLLCSSLHYCGESEVCQCNGRGEDLQNFQSYTVHALGCNGLRAKRKSCSIKFLSNVTWFWASFCGRGQRFSGSDPCIQDITWQTEGKFEMGYVHLIIVPRPMVEGREVAHTVKGWPDHINSFNWKFCLQACWHLLFGRWAGKGSRVNGKWQLAVCSPLEHSGQPKQAKTEISWNQNKCL